MKIRPISIDSWIHTCETYTTIQVSTNVYRLTKLSTYIRHRSLWFSTLQMVFLYEIILRSLIKQRHMLFTMHCIIFLIPQVYSRKINQNFSVKTIVSSTFLITSFSSTNNLSIQHVCDFRRCDYWMYLNCSSYYLTVQTLPFLLLPS